MYQENTHDKRDIFSGIYTRTLRRVCIPNTSDKSDIPRYTTRERCIYSLYHAIENPLANPIHGLHTVECITDFLYSDWLYFPWHGINNVIRDVFKC